MNDYNNSGIYPRLQPRRICNALEWYEVEIDALKALLREALEYTDHTVKCDIWLAKGDPCSCGCEDYESRIDEALK